MKTPVFESWPVMEWILGREPATSVIDRLLEDADKSKVHLLMSAIEMPSSEDIWSAALLKGQFPLSYADAFAAALAQKYNCPAVAGDPEFRSVEHLRIEWVGRT